MRSISTAEAADLTGLHVETIRTYLRRGRLRATRIGRIYLIDRKALNPLIANRPHRGRPRRVPQGVVSHL
jgi:DNA binding domain, excisionase family